MRQLVFLCLCTAYGGCQLASPALKPALFEHRLQREGLVVQSTFELPADHRLVEQLIEQRGTLTQKLGLPATERPIHVFLFADADSYYPFLAVHFPGFPSRRALFVETESQLSVYAYWGDHVAEDLRHEVAHGYLHAAVPNLPLWLDEGLAEYFEVPPSRQGLNRPHVELLLQQQIISDWQPDLARLERLTSAASMSQLDYAEAWAWVHFLLESEGDKSGVLVEHLASLYGGAGDQGLSSRVRKRLARPELAMLEHLRELR